jgi:hypothetical protein
MPGGAVPSRSPWNSPKRSRFDGVPGNGHLAGTRAPFHDFARENWRSARSVLELLVDTEARRQAGEVGTPGPEPPVGSPTRWGEKRHEGRAR